MTATTHEQHQGDRRSLIKAFVASLSGTSLEWYDFALYGAASAVVFEKLFFPADDPGVALIKVFLTYAAGYVSRPLGGIIFGRLGDKIGRKKVLVWTLLMIGVATFLIGALPSYENAGLWAPILLVALRFLQGVGVGGEWGGAVLLSSEFAKPGTRGFWASAAQIGVPLGSVLANLVMLIMTATLSQADFIAWGWRVAFGFSLVLVAFGLWIRHQLEETPVFQKILEKGEAPKAPVTEVFKTQGRALLGAILSRLGPDVLYAFFAVFVLVWLKQGPGRLSNSEALACTMTAGALQVITMPFAGWLSDRVNRRLLYGIAAVAGAVWAFAFIGLTQTRSFALGMVGVIVGLICHSFMYAPQAAHIAEQFHARLRYTGSSLAYTFAGILGGGFAPMMFAWIITFNQQGWLLAGYIAIAAVLTIVGLAMGKAVVDDVDTEDDPALTAASESR